VGTVRKYDHQSEASNIMNDMAIHNPRTLQSCLIETIGETVECQGNRVRRIAAKEIVKRDSLIWNAKDGSDVMLVLAEIAGLKDRLASPSVYFAAELLREPEPYSADGILFPALVHLVRIEKDALEWGWPPEQLRALGLAMNYGEELTWLTPEWAEISDRDGNRRRIYRFPS
jgi:hypothetical protein